MSAWLIRSLVSSFYDQKMLKKVNWKITHSLYYLGVWFLHVRNFDIWKYKINKLQKTRCVYKMPSRWVIGNDE